MNELDFVVRANADYALFSVSDLFSTLSTGTTLHSTVAKLASELHFLGKPKTDYDILMEISPDDHYFFDLFEVMSVNIDNSLYAHLHMPAFKLHYPEPFIASPSFVHEELWFIHILHYHH
jgi:hypothetical protein